MKTFKTTIEKPILTISYDNNPTTPREWTNLGYFIVVSRNYCSPDKNDFLYNIIKFTSEIANNQKHHIELIKEEIESNTTEKVLSIYPISQYDHSGVCYSLGNQKGFDYSNNGFYIVTDKTSNEIGVKPEDFEEVIKAELDCYNQYCNGEVYEFVLYDEEGNIEDSCGGFYSIDEIKENLPEEFQDEDLEEYFIQ